jgi:hypothetical protein
MYYAKPVQGAGAPWSDSGIIEERKGERGEVVVLSQPAFDQVQPSTVIFPFLTPARPRQ